MLNSNFLNPKLTYCERVKKELENINTNYTGVF